VFTASGKIIRAAEVRTVWNIIDGASLIIADSFSSKEQKYAHYLTQASWAGARIIQGQWTPQAEKLYDLLILTFSADGHLCDLEKLQQQAGVSPSEWEDLLQYASQVYTCRPYINRSRLTSILIQVLSNLVNYKSFGFTKIIPRIPVDKFESVVGKCADSEKALALWKEVRYCAMVNFRNSQSVLYSSKSTYTL
jgi:dipeptidyl-peptidase III